MPPPLPPPILLRILQASTSALPTIDTLTNLWLSLRPVCRAFRTEIESIFVSSYLPNLEIRVAVYSQDVYQTCDPTARLGEVKYDARRPSVPSTAEGIEEEGGSERMGKRGERVGRGGGVEEKGLRSEIKEGKVEVPADIVFKFTHTTTPTSGDGGDVNVNGTAVFTPPLPYSTSLPTAMALASLASRFSSRLMVKKPTHVVSWYGCVNDVFLPGLKVDLVRGWVEVEWKGLVGGLLGEEGGVCGVRRGLVGGGKGVRGLCALGGGMERGRMAKAGAATRSGVNESMHESPTMDLPMAKKRRGNGTGKAKGRGGVRRKFGRDKVDLDMIDKSASMSSAAPVVIDLDAVQTPISPPSPDFDFDFDFDRNLDMDLTVDLLSEPEWQHIPSPPHRLDADFGFDFSSSSPPPLPFALSSSPLSSLATSPVTPPSQTTPRPRSPSLTLYSHSSTFYPLPTPPPPPIPTNTLNWDIDPARLEARRRRVAHLFRKFCCNGEKNVGVGNASVGGNDVGREMGENIRGKIEREMRYRGWIMGEWCAVEHVQSLTMEVGG